jgi:hypothetical protein
MMNVYQYIAETNPDASYELCNQYGVYDIQSFNELSSGLMGIVAQDGENGFKKVMELHPDREVVLELFQVVPEAPKTEPTPIVIKDCGCDGSGNMMNANGLTNSINAVNSGLAMNTNTIILISALIVSISIIASMKNKN